VWSISSSRCLQSMLGGCWVDLHNAAGHRVHDGGT
jgi:hypothetical protein